MENIPPRHNKLLTGWRRRPRAGTLIPPPSSGLSRGGFLKRGESKEKKKGTRRDSLRRENKERFRSHQENIMSCPEAVSQWESIVSTHLPHLSRPQARVLAWWSYGMVLAKSCGITSVVAILDHLLRQSESTMRQRLREWCYPRKQK